MSRTEAAALAQSRGFTFYYPTYWPKNLPQPDIKGGRRAAYTSQPAYTWVSVAAGTVIPPAQREKGIDPGTAMHRFACVAFTHVDETPERWRLILPGPHPNPSGTRGRQKRDPFHGYRPTELNVPIQVRGRQAVIRRALNMPFLRLSWIEGRTNICLWGLNVPERELLRMARSLRPVRAKP